MIKQQDSLAFLKDQPDLSVDINYSDPPYALGSEITIRPDGKVDYAKASDFMNKWDMPTGDWWSAWFDEAYRSLKHGGYCIMFGMDRQLLLFKYYAHLAGFTEKQSLYWYFISNFPKATDLSKMIDKNAGAEREVISTQKVPDIIGDAFSTQNDKQKASYDNIDVNITAPSTPLAQKYSGYKYSIAPLKQTNETIMVFQKPYKTKSCLHDTLAFENGDESISVGAVDIDGNRVEAKSDKDLKELRSERPSKSKTVFDNYTDKDNSYFDRSNRQEVTGRYPSQTFCDSSAAEVLDRQSGVSGGGKYNKLTRKRKGFMLSGSENNVQEANAPDQYGDTGGCSKILHKCDFEKDEHDIYFYNPKVSKSERNAGCEEFEAMPNNKYAQDKWTIENMGFAKSEPATNNHPTLKPIALNEKVIKLFKTPNDQRIIFPFGGAGSEIIGGIKAGFTNWSACELSEEYVEIAKARIKYWTNISHTTKTTAVSATENELVQNKVEQISLI